MNFASFNANEPQLSVCQCCLNKEVSKAISKGYYDIRKKEVYKKMLEDVFNIQCIQESVTMEPYICKECLARLYDASSFKEMVLRNDKIYQECLQSLYRKDLPESELEVEEIKLEGVPVSMDFSICDGDEQNDSFDDNETLANLKNETHKKAAILNSTKEFCSLEKTYKTKKCKTKSKDQDTEESQHLVKLSDHRGSGPVLRENSLKLLAHSTAAVFQWNKSRYRCFCCNEPYSDINILKQHTTCHSLEDIQKKIINQQNRLVKVEISILNCKICNQELKDLDHLKEHLLEHSIVVEDHLLVPFKIESKLKCQLCSEPFTLFRLLNIHMNKHYQKHVCYICGAGFSNLVFLNLHRTRSHRPFRCQVCDINFVSRTEKKQHDTQVHGAKYERKNRFPCPFCQERFFQENLRVKHLVDKHGVNKPEFSCQICLKSFITRSLLNNHVKVVHMKERNHECDVCHNLFYTKSDVSRHRVTHTGEKKYACTLCSNPFASRDSLRRHMKRSHGLQ